MASPVDDTGRIEANSDTDGGMTKVCLHEWADVSQAVSQLASCAQAVLKRMPHNITPRSIVRYDSTNRRLALIILASIPLSIITAMLALYVGGQILNSLTLGGSALATGALVAGARLALDISSQITSGQKVAIENPSEAAN